ncbi:MAG: hypothetical protein KIS77_05550 [Saprospiraceae bacterium]|nr:hypothetical protein [Saprospiraceae bacterium]
MQLASKHAHHFYENDLLWLPLPEDIDSGHPPTFGYYLACAWSFFGKTLPVSHWAMLPFLLLNVWLLYRLGQQIGDGRWAFWLLPLVLLDPVVASQSTLVSPDIVLTCGFLFALNGILDKHRTFVVFGILMLCMISLRGMMTAGALFMWQAILHGRNLSKLVGGAAPFLPGFAFAAWFFGWHQAATGWIGMHPNSPWAPTFEPAKDAMLFRNLMVVGWRWLDFGRLFEWLLLAWLGWRYWPQIKSNHTARHFVLLLLCLVAFLSPSALLFANVSAHRYFLPGFIALHLLVFQLVATIRFKKIRPNHLLTTLIILFALSNLWVYPRGISVGWDATLAHIPYHRLRAEAVSFLEQESIDFALVGSYFPNLNTGEHLLLNGDPRRFSGKDFVRNQYVFASNVFNDISDEDFHILQRDWTLRKSWTAASVWVEIYQKKH